MPTDYRPELLDTLVDLDNVHVKINNILAAMTAEIEPPFVTLKKDDNLQKALDGVDDGTEIRAYPEFYDGVTLTRALARGVTLRPNTVEFDENGDDSWVMPEQIPAMIRIRANANDVTNAIATVQGASGYRFIGCQFLPGRPDVAIANLGSDAETIPERQPRNLAFDRCVFMADAVKGGIRGIAANTGAFSLTRSYLDQFWFSVQSQGMSTWNGPGPHNVENNWIAASGENLIFGGGTSRTAGMMARNAVVRGNYLTKRLEWQVAGQLTHKAMNVLEFKAVIGALVENNVLENSWAGGGQEGFLVVMTPRNQAGSSGVGKSPWTEVSDILLQYNVLRNGGSGFNMLGTDNEQPSGPLKNVRILNNLVYGINKRFGGDGMGMLMNNGPSGVELAFNTVLDTRDAFLVFDGKAKCNDFKVHHNVFGTEGLYGIRGTDLGIGKPSWDGYVTNGLFETNLVGRSQAAKDAGRNIKYPGATNAFAPIGTGIVDSVFALMPPFTGFGVDVVELKRRVAMAF